MCAHTKAVCVACVFPRLALFRWTPTCDDLLSGKHGKKRTSVRSSVRRRSVEQRSVPRSIRACKLKSGKRSAAAAVVPPVVAWNHCNVRASTKENLQPRLKSHSAGTAGSGGLEHTKKVGRSCTQLLSQRHQRGRGRGRRRR